MTAGDPREAFDLARRLIGASRAVADLRPADTEIAQTPSDEIWRSGKTSVRRYRAEREPRFGPLVILHGLIGRQTMTDLEPRRSLVRRMVGAGADVYAVDWGWPTRADRCLGFEDFCGWMLEEALGAVRDAAGRPPALLGICEGGVFALCHAAWRPGSLAGLAVAITPVDFHADLMADAEEPGARGLLNHWMRTLPATTVDALIEDTGNLPGRLTGAVFQALTPGRTFAKYTTDFLAAAEDPDELATFLRMERWLADRPDHPGQAARQWLVELYQENRLAKGRFAPGGRAVDLAAIDVPVLNVYGTRDHIVPPACSRALGGLLPKGHDYQEVSVPTGHVGVFVSRRVQEIVPGAILGWLARL